MNRRVTAVVGTLASAAAITAGGATLPAIAQPIRPEPVAATVPAVVPASAPAAAVQRPAHWSREAKLRLGPSTPALATCFPHARARVSVALTTAKKGKDTFTVRAWGLKPHTDFTVFLVEQAGAPFGAAEYIGDFTTNRHGRGHNTFRLIVEEAFAFDNVSHARTDLNSVGIWFADPKDDDGCLGPDSPVTGFDGDAEAGVQMLNSGTYQLP